MKNVYQPMIIVASRDFSLELSEYPGKNSDRGMVLRNGMLETNYSFACGPKSRDIKQAAMLPSRDGAFVLRDCVPATPSFKIQSARARIHVI